MTEIIFGFNTSDTIPLKREVEFARNNGFTCLQVWYDYRGFSYNNRRTYDVQELKECFSLYSFMRS